MPRPAAPGAPILVVEDQADLCETLVEIFTLSGYAAVGVEHGAAALAYLEDHAAPAFILLDLTMPVMDGWTFRARQREEPRFAGIPVVVSTALPLTPAEVDHLGAVAYLQKPAPLKTLLQLAAQLVPALAA